MKIVDWKSWLEKHKTSMLAAAGILAMALLLLPGLFSSGAKEDAAPQTELEAAESLEKYASALEQKLCETLGAVEGVGRVKVLLTMEKGQERVYATERQSGTGNRTSLTGESQKSIENTADSNEKYILVRGASGAEEPILLRVLEPTVRGVVILCEGGGDPGVRESVIAAAKAALAVPANRISVHKLSNGGME